MLSKRNLDDTEAEILNEKKKKPEQRETEILRIVLKDNPAAKVGEDSVRKDFHEVETSY